MQDGDIVELTFDKMAHGGEALGRLAGDGRVVFAGYAMPEDTARVRLTDVRKRWARGEVTEILTRAPDRIDPPCPHFGPDACGGCQWQYATYEAQLRFKTNIVRDQLQRIGKFDDPPVRDCIGMEDPWYYRNHVQLHLTEDGELGFVRADDAGIEPIRTCLIMNEVVYELFQEVEPAFEDITRIGLRGSVRTGERMVVVETEADTAPEVEVDSPVSVVMVLADGSTSTLVGSPYYHEEVAGRRWRISANSFFQTNTEMAEHLVEVVREFAQPLLGIETVVDAYAGVGMLGISLADEVARVILVEENEEAVRDAEVNGEGVGNTSAYVERAEVALPEWEVEPPDLVVLDPPRAGCEEKVLKALRRLEVPKVIYVSCDPATLARDLHQLHQDGYQLQAVQPLDMFPQTYHIEAAAMLTLE